VITIENGTLLVRLIGRFGDFPPTDQQVFRALAEELHSDLADRIIKDAEQLTPIAHHRFAAAFDFAFPQTRGTRPPGTEERARYFVALDELQGEDAEVRRRMTELFQLLQPLSVLQQESLRSRVLARL
jgi:hypothetical protein